MSCRLHRTTTESFVHACFQSSIFFTGLGIFVFQIFNFFKKFQIKRFQFGPQFGIFQFQFLHSATAAAAAAGRVLPGPTLQLPFRTVQPRLDRRQFGRQLIVLAGDLLQFFFRRPPARRRRRTSRHHVLHVSLRFAQLRVGRRQFLLQPFFGALSVQRRASKFLLFVVAVF